MSRRTMNARQIDDYVVDLSEGVAATSCRGCKRTIRLWFNGGELDRLECCGFTYALEHGDIHLTTYETVRDEP